MSLSASWPPTVCSVKRIFYDFASNASMSMDLVLLMSESLSNFASK
jgi:hypothetical protein